MDLRGISNGASTIVNPNEAIIIQRSVGYTVGAGGKQVPTYAADVNGFAQVQALDGAELKQLDSLNIQGVLRAIYLRGALAGVIRPSGTGGDLVKRKNGTETWLVVKVLESWSDWTKAVIQLQSP
jgi:hypothetical protein